MRSDHSVFKTATFDFVSGIKMFRVWLALAKEDIGEQHKRTFLGPLWLLINYLLFAGTFIYVFKVGGGEPGYAGYVALGLLIWIYMSEVVSQGVMLFVREESFIKGTRLPLTAYAMRLMTQIAIRAGYAILGCIAILLFDGEYPTASWLASAGGIFLILLATPAVIFICAFVGVFYPDMQFVIANAMRIGMFLTPVFWTYDDTGGVRHMFYYWNPFTYFLEIVRIPVVGGVGYAESIFVCSTLVIGFWVVAFMLLGKLRNQVAFLL